MQKGKKSFVFLQQTNSKLNKYVDSSSLKGYSTQKNENLLTLKLLQTCILSSAEHKGRYFEERLELCHH